MSEDVGKSRNNWLIFLSAALLLGAFLRLCFPGDIEYKNDEKYMFAASRAGMAQPWPQLGMSSGVGIKNPGMSVWVFMVLSELARPTTPPDLARAVQLLNLLALLVLAFFSLRLVPEQERSPWCWATAFAAVNPLAVLFERKIWAQSTLPLFCVLFWISWHYRHKRTGAFFWGLIGICLGQIHLSGFFLAAGVFIWTAIRDRQARWVFWLTGSLLGSIPIIPLLGYIHFLHANSLNWMNLVSIQSLKYWYFFVTDSLGQGLAYSLGMRPFLDFLQFPVMGGNATNLVEILNAVMVSAGIVILVLVLKSGDGLRAAGIADSTDTGLALQSVLLVSGLLMTLTGAGILRHYLIMAFPLEWVFLARLGLCDLRWGRLCLGLIWAAQLMVSVLFLVYIHLHHGSPMGDYGVAYQYQAP